MFFTHTFKSPLFKSLPGVTTDKTAIQKYKSNILFKSLKITIKRMSNFEAKPIYKKPCLILEETLTQEFQ